MVGISALLQQIPPIPRTAPSLLRTSQFTPPWLPKTLIKSPKNESRLVAFAAERGPNKGQNGSGNGRDDMKRNGRPIFSLKWQDLLDPDPENILAVGLTGLLTWASVQVLCQLFFISLAILVAALNDEFLGEELHAIASCFQLVQVGPIEW
ncbi:uncharacterized protein LOC131235390 isoform X3 [Magnolia sinica]|uniref:uncharacterized protein LOC131235390 isoform X3 n=1 Tax=Magnolia sinica TaxID=86752 RepID=UPI002658BD99|nr:uncharacterized protein LOC131235390 isoform X3 [Magnolia sinica]